MLYGGHFHKRGLSTLMKLFVLYIQRLFFEMGHKTVVRDVEM